MILTVTANTTLDQTLIIPALAEDHTIRATDSVYSMGGKSTNASYILAKLGVDSCALGFAAGLNGQKVKSLLEERNITVDFIEVDGETRTSTAIICTETNHQYTITTSTMHVQPHHVQQLMERYKNYLEQPVDCVVMGGTLPTGMDSVFYTDLIKFARDKDIPVLLDAHGGNLAAGLKSRPFLIKPNHHELGRFMNRIITSIHDAYFAGREILDQYGTACVISMGAGGILAVLPERAYHVPPLPVDVISTVGAGDAVMAGVAASVARKQPIEEGLRLSAATATAVLQTTATADFNLEDMERLLQQVQLLEYTPM